MKQEPVNEIEAESIGKFFDLVIALPETPLGDGKCQLIKVPAGGGRWRTDCSGACDVGGPCRHVHGIDGTTIFAKCEC